jgi:hypothetical protein
MKSPLIALAAGLFAVPTAAKEPVRLAPVSPWNLHYGENSCRLGRTFGDKDKPTTLVLERASPGSPMSLLVFGDGVQARQNERNASAYFSSLEVEGFKEGTVLETVEKKRAILWMYVDFLAGPRKPEKDRRQSERPTRDLAKESAESAELAANAAGITEVKIVEPGGRTLILETGKLGKVHTMMQDCAREQLQAWGIDPAIEDRIVRPAWSRAGVARLFSSNDYPRDAVRAGEQATIQARLNIGSDGRVTKCTSLTLYKAPDFAKVVCDRLQKARYEPAELADGTKVPSYNMATIKFLMP